jgi:NAD-dependent deacetylase
VWFGEVPRELERVERAIATASHFAAIGTSGQVWPAAGWLARARGFRARTTVQALEAPENLDPRDEFLGGHAADIVPRWVERILSQG